MFEDTGQGEAVRVSAAQGREGVMLSSFTVLRIGASQTAMNDPAKRDAAGEERGTGAKDRCAEVSEGGDGSGGL